MGIELRTATPDDVASMFQADARAFGFSYTDELIQQVLPTLDLTRFHLAFDGGRIVGVIGSFGFDVTLPGGGTVPAGGVTWVSVQPTHRRQGLLRRLMDACHADIDARGEPVAMLNASEGGIYERFGYGIAATERLVTINRNGAAFRPEVVPPAGTVWPAEHDEIERDGPALWDRFRRLRAGELSRSDAWHTFLAVRRRKESDGMTEAFHLRHADGYVSYRFAQDWNEGQPQHKVELVEMVACTPDAHAALWHTVLGLDLVGVVRTRQMPLDDPLPYLLQNARVVVSSGVDDNVWVHPRNVVSSFGARTYGSDDRLVVEAAGRRWAIEGSPEGASCRPVRSRPDLVTDVAGLGVLLLGGVRPSVLAAGRRVGVRDQRTLRRADAFFLGDRLPLCQTDF